MTPADLLKMDAFDFAICAACCDQGIAAQVQAFEAGAQAFPVIPMGMF